MIMATDGSEFWTMAANLGLASMSLASQGATFLISLYDSKLARLVTGATLH